MEGAIGPRLRRLHGEHCQWVCDSNDTAADEGEFEANHPFPTWDQFLRANLITPAMAQLVITVLLCFLAPIYSLMYNRQGAFYQWIHLYIGTTTRPKVRRPHFVMMGYTIQVILSILDTCIYAIRTYTIGSSSRDKLYHVEYVLAIFFTGQYSTLRLHAMLQPSSAWSAGGIIDVLTIVPVLFPTDGHQAFQWLNLKFLRIYRALQDFQMLMKAVDATPDVSKDLFVTVLRTIALVVVMGGVIFILEVLGDLPTLEDKYVATGMGDLSFMQMNYWIFTTISTVGYGDFSPTTMPSRMVIVVFIIIGVVFFGNESAYLVSLISDSSTGKGQYKLKRGQSHIVVAGTGLTRLSSLVETFLLEALNPASDMQIPDIVFLCEENFDQIANFVNTALLPAVRSHVCILDGSALVPRDLERVRLDAAVMAFVIPDLASTHVTQEDSKNILRALEMLRQAPTLKLRVMLGDPHSVIRCMNLGMPRERIFSSTALKAALFAQSTRVLGIAPFILGILQNTSGNLMHVDPAQLPEWRRNYNDGLKKQVCAFAVGSEYDGMHFSTFACTVYEQSDGEVLPLAAQVDGRQMINYQGTLELHQVVTAICENASMVTPFSSANVDWYTAFIQRRQAAIDTSSLKSAAHAAASESIRSQRLEHHTGSKSSGELTRFDSKKDDNKLLQEVMEKPEGPMVALLVSGDQPSTWMHVEAFIHYMRQSDFPTCQPITILSDMQPPERVVDEFEPLKCTFLCGPLLNVVTLNMASVSSAQAVVAVCGEDSENEGNSLGITDFETAKLSLLLEEVIDTDTGEVEVVQNVMYDFGSTHAVALLQVQEDCKDAKNRLKMTLATGKTKELDVRPVPPKSEIAMLLHSVCRTCGDALQVVGSIFSEGLGKHEEAFEAAMATRLITQTRFSAGQAFSPDFFGAVLGHMIQFPGTLELVEALLMHSRRDQLSLPWQVPCPSDWVGKRYFDLVRAWLSGTGAEMGSWAVPPGGQPAIVVGIYRAHETSMGRITGYMYTMPDKDTILAATDLITMVGPVAVGQALMDLGVLREASPQAKPSDGGPVPPSAAAPELPGQWGLGASTT